MVRKVRADAVLAVRERLFREAASWILYEDDQARNVPAGCKDGALGRDRQETRVDYDRAEKIRGRPAFVA
ncbi:hypothetical protein SDC9_179017 [bioreactor metagenome]|uniref:Uncharacterized protein n=1 Tax=bioreactor metagenome TaxID=1076179 RepID=A0A645H6U3_9ZZZZ